MTPSPPAASPVDPPAPLGDGHDPRPGRAAARLARVVENAVTAANLSLPQYRMLAHLHELGSARASALAGKLGVSRPSVTALIDGLVSRGWAERAADPEDRRRVSHAITPAGVAALEAADARVADRLADLAAKIDGDDEREAAYRGLLHWLSAMDAEREAKLADG